MAGGVIARLTPSQEAVQRHRVQQRLQRIVRTLHLGGRCVPETASTSRDCSVFVGDAAESVVTSDAHLVEVDGFRQGAQRCGGV